VSLRAGARAFPALLRIGFAEAIAYRAELFIWILTSTMPLIMLALWSTVAAEAPVGRFGEAEVTAYFLSTFIVRQLAASWTCWEINFEVRLGKLSMRLLRPVHPIVAYAAEGIAALPLRLVIAIPVALWMLTRVGTDHFPHDVGRWLVFVASVVGAWMLTFLINVAVGALSFFMESSTKLMDVYLAAHFVFSGYVVPIELFPPTLRAAADHLPFRYQLGFPVEVLCGDYQPERALTLLGQQWLFVGLIGALALYTWRRGVRHFEAFGG
jgi:ABC-2 type transport system permease protein